VNVLAQRGRRRGARPRCAARRTPPPCWAGPLRRVWRSSPCAG